jgi:hypothetical protein
MAYGIRTHTFMECSKKGGAQHSTALHFYEFSHPLRTYIFLILAHRRRWWSGGPLLSRGNIIFITLYESTGLISERDRVVFLFAAAAAAPRIRRGADEKMHSLMYI